MNSKNFADIKDQFIGTDKVLVSPEHAARVYDFGEDMIPGEVHECISVLLGITIPNSSASFCKARWCERKWYCDSELHNETWGLWESIAESFCDSLVLSWFGVRLPKSSLQVSIQLRATIDTVMNVSSLVLPALIWLPPFCPLLFEPWASHSCLHEYSKHIKDCKQPESSLRLIGVRNTQLIVQAIVLNEFHS